MNAAGFTVSEAVVRLANDTPEVVAPESETTYEVGEFTTIDDGTVNVTRRVVPMMVITAVATVEPEGPAPGVAGFRLTCTCAGLIVPAGKFEPVTLIVVTPACPFDGDVAGESETWVCAATPMLQTTTAAAVREKIQLWPGFWANARAVSRSMSASSAGRYRVVNS